MHQLLFQAYRRAYAELLAMWANQLACLEIASSSTSLQDYSTERDTLLAAPKAFAESIALNDEKEQLSTTYLHHQLFLVRKPICILSHPRTQEALTLQVSGP